MIRKHPLQCEPLLVTPERQRLTAYQLYNLFHPIHSVDGSNVKEKELEVSLFWMCFLEECEGEDGHLMQWKGKKNVRINIWTACVHTHCYSRVS